MTKCLRMLGRACAVAAFITLCLCSYCAYTTASFIHGADELTGTIVGVERHPAEKDRSDLRPVVQLEVVPGRIETHRFSGLYRVDSAEIGKPITILYNPESAPRLAPSSGWNWIGSVVYGSCTVVLAAMSTVLIVAACRANAHKSLQLARQHLVKPRKWLTA